MSIIGLLVNFIILCIVIAIVYFIIKLALGALAQAGVPVPPFAMTIVNILVLLIVLLWLLDIFAGAGHFRVYRY
jgi:hypothetical protein